MDKWIILNKFIILIYCSIKYVNELYSRDFLIILGFLLYISINMIYYIISKRRFKVVIDILMIIGLILLGTQGNSIFLLFLPITFIQFVYSNNLNNIYTIALIFISTILIDKNIIAEYFLILLFSYLIYVLSYNNHYKIEKLLKRRMI